MAFDPDAYLAEKQFDPDEYLKQVAPQPAPAPAQEPDMMEQFKTFAASPAGFMAQQAPKVYERLTGGAPITPATRQELGAFGYTEPVTAMGAGMVAEPVAGLAGLLAAPLVGPERGEEIIKSTREALSYVPESPKGIKAGQVIGKAVEPIARGIKWTEKTLGDAAYKATGSPTIGALATTLPAAVIEVLGFGAGRKAVKGAPKVAPKIGKVKEKAVTRALVEAAPDIQQIKDASRSIYKEIDDLNVAVKPSAHKAMINKVINRAVKENVDDVLTPKSARVVQQLQSELDAPSPQSISNLDQIRKRAQIAAQSTDPADARVGAIMVDEIDDYLDNIPQSAFTGPDVATVGKIGERYKAARGLWGRARRAELVGEVFDKAQRQATGFENGLRTQLRQILNNKKRARFFTKEELSAMDDVVKGTSSANILKLVGRLGFSEGAATNVLGGLVGMGVLGPLTPVVGQASRAFAQKATLKAAKRMETLIRGGAKGKEIAKHYLVSVPKAKRNIQELSDLLLTSGSELDDLLTSANKTIKEAAEIARARKTLQAAEAAGVGAATAIQPERE